MSTMLVNILFQPISDDQHTPREISFWYQPEPALVSIRIRFGIKKRIRKKSQRHNR
jgi:hypothetical protein